MQSATLHCGEPLALWYDLVRDGASRTGTRLPESVEIFIPAGPRLGGGG